MGYLILSKFNLTLNAFGCGKTDYYKQPGQVLNRAFICPGATGPSRGFRHMRGDPAAILYN